MINQMISSTAGGAVVGAASSSIFTGVGLVIGGPIGAAVGFGFGTVTGTVAGTMLGNELSKSLNKTKIQIQSKERELDMDWSRFSEGSSKGFDMFISILKGKDLIDAMKDIKEYFEKQDTK